MRVLKFGGTSVGDTEAILRLAAITRSRASEPLLLVVSAVGHTTDALEAMGRAAASGRLDFGLQLLRDLRLLHARLAGELLEAAQERRALLTHFDRDFASIERLAGGLAAVEEFSPAVQDRLLHFGELLSSRLVSAALAARGLPTVWVDVRELVVTESIHGGAEPLIEETGHRCREAFAPLLARRLVPVTQGFIARDLSGAPTTLGRGGSDFTASLIGAALGAEEIEIWTDVDGIMTADPSLVPEARNIPVMSFREAAELAFFGARVLHPKTLAPAVERGIPVRVLNTRRAEGRGTLVLAEAPRDGRPVRSIAYKEGVTLVHLVSARMFKAHGFLARLFEILDRHGVVPDALATSEVSVAMAFQGCPSLQSALRELSKLGSVTVREGQAVVCVVGEGLRDQPGLAGRVFDALGEVPVSLISEGGSEVALGFVIAESDLASAVRSLHRRFFGQAAEAAVAGKEAARG
ncbi:MAG: aspartate kinase [Acidobacteriota bacterium]